VLIYPCIIIPKPCAKRSNTEEAVERYSLSSLFEGYIPKKKQEGVGRAEYSVFM
jgi:hypothetical protein